MKLINMLQKFKSKIIEAVHLKDVSDDVERTEGPSARIIILAENKKSVRIVCWRCGHVMWVARGSMCHLTGQCWRCLSESSKESS